MPGSKGDTGPIGPPGKPGEKGDEVRGTFVVIHISMVILTDCIEGLHHVLLTIQLPFLIEYFIFLARDNGEKTGLMGQMLVMINFKCYIRCVYVLRPVNI